MNSLCTSRMQRLFGVKHAARAGRRTWKHVVFDVIFLACQC